MAALETSAQTDNLFGYTDEAVTKEVDKYKENVNTKLSFKDAATFVAEATPIIGDALAAKEVYDELQKDDPNYLLVGALGGAALVSLIPGLGDAAAKAIKTGAKKTLDTAKRIEVDPNTLGSVGGNINLKAKAANSPDEPKNYAYRTDNPATKGYEGGEEWLESKQKTAEDRAKNSSEENSTGKLLSGSITGYMGQDFKRPLFLSTEMLSKLKGANNEKRYVGEGRYDLLRKRVDKEGFDPEQKYSSEDDYGNAIVIGVNHKGKAFIIEGNTRVAVAKDLDVPSIRAEVKYYNGAEEVDGPYSPQNIIQYADKPKDFNKGGAVMNEQMEMAFMQEGGLKDDGMRQDPVSGNEVPSGSMASEVRDDIPAQLSEGEYVVPADVVRFFGVKFFEDLRMEAKMGLQSMEANGRIGGEPVAAPQEGTLSDEEFAMLLQKELQMAEGGMVPEMDQTMGTPAPIKAAEGTLVPTKRFNPFRYAGLGSTLTPGYLPPAPPTEELPAVDTEESCAARGMVLGPNGVCIMPTAKPVTTRGSDDDPAVPTETAEAKPWYEDDSTLFTDPSSYIEAQLGRGEMFDNPLMRAGALMAGPLGLVAGAASKIGDIEGIARSRAALEVARATGSLPTEEIERLQKLIDTDVQGNPLVDQDGKGFGIATGQNYLNDFAKSLGFANWSQATKPENKEKLVGFQKSRETGFTSKKLQSMTPEERKAMIDKANEGAKKKQEAAKTSGGGSSGKDDGPSAASMMKERLDKQAKEQGQTGGFSGSVTGGAVYAGGNRAEGGLMLKKKKPKKKK